MASGAARLVDWYGLFDSYNQSRNGAEADGRAIFSDWRIVGQEIDDALTLFGAAHIDR